MMIVRVLLSLGANLGDRCETLRQAVQMLQARSLLTSMRVSTLYETEPVGVTNQPSFINLCVVGECRISAQDLRVELRSIETELGRIQRPQWHERELDIDIILFGTHSISDPILHVPHLRMHERRFVLVPAAEIASSMMHPARGQTIAELLDVCPDLSQIRVYVSGEYNDL